MNADEASLSDPPDRLVDSEHSIADGQDTSLRPVTLSDFVGHNDNKKEFQNKGFATIALQLTVDKARDLGIKKLIALVAPENLGSKKIFIKNDFKEKLHWLEKTI